MIGSGSSNNFWGRIEGREVFLVINGGNFKFLGRNQSREKSISRHSYYERKIKGRYGVKMAYAVLGGRYRIGNI